MTITIDELCKQLDITQELPPVDKWHPELSGDIDMRVDSSGVWFHESAPIERDRLVKLFSSILRFDEEDGYCLVTPVEKWRITVEDVPFIIERFEKSGEILAMITNVADMVLLDSLEKWQLRDYQGVLLPYVLVRDKLWARVSRPVYYQLAGMAEDTAEGIGVQSAGLFFPLEIQAP